MGHLAFEIINLAALLAMGVGFFWKDRRCHLLRLFGWAALGTYWVIRAPEYFAHDDMVNGLGAALALPIFLFLAYHEYRSYQWDDDYPPLRFVAGALFIAGMGYFIIGNVPQVREFLIDVTAHQSVGLVNLFGYNYGVEGVTSESAALNPGPIHIILECTAIQAYLVAGSFLFGCRGDRRRRTMTFLLIAPVVYVVNLVRNALVIILVHNGTDFDFAHNYIGKTLSLVVLIILILVAFKIVPQLYEDINGMFELPWRKGPDHDYLRFVGRIYKEKKEENEEEETD